MRQHGLQQIWKQMFANCLQMRGTSMYKASSSRNRTPRGYYLPPQGGIPMGIRGPVVGGGHNCEGSVFFVEYAPESPESFRRRRKRCGKSISPPPPQGGGYSP